MGANRILLLIAALSVGASARAQDFREVSWRMSREEVVSREVMEASQ